MRVEEVGHHDGQVDRDSAVYLPVMTTPDAHTVISVRGESQRIVAPDQASANLLINVRDFEQLGRVEGIVTGHDVVNIGSVHWSVDEDNPARPQVRADAIRTALHKGQDYASALGGSIVSVEHIADAGLLGSDMWHDMAHRKGGDVPLAYMGGAHSTSLYPVPQAVGATIEARLTATIGPLPTT